MYDKSESVKYTFIKIYKCIRNKIFVINMYFDCVHISDILITYVDICY